MNVFRFTLQETDFRELVRGRVVTLTPSEGGKTIEIALADIGWERMYFQIERALRDAGDGDV